MIMIIFMEIRLFSMQLKSLVRSGDPSLVKTQMHDFGFRGVSSYETSASKSHR